MFYYVVIFYFIAPVWTLTIDVAFEHGPDREYKFNIKSKDAGPPSNRNAVQQNRAIVPYEDDTFYSQDNTDVKDDISEEDSASITTNFSTETLKKYTPRYENREKSLTQKRTKHRAVESYDSEGNYKEIDDMSGKSEHDMKDIQNTGDYNSNNSGNDEDADDDDNDKSNNFRQGFTQPLKDNLKEQTKNALNKQGLNSKREDKVFFKQLISQNEKKDELNNVLSMAYSLIGNIFGTHHNNTFIHAYGNKPKITFQPNLDPHEQKLMNDTQDISKVNASQENIQDIKSDTPSDLDVVTDPSNPQLVLGWNITMENINDKDFYSTPAMVLPTKYWTKGLRIPKHDEISKIVPWYSIMNDKGSKTTLQ